MHNADFSPNLSKDKICMVLWVYFSTLPALNFPGNYIITNYITYCKYFGKKNREKIMKFSCENIQKYMNNDLGGCLKGNPPYQSWFYIKLIIKSVQQIVKPDLKTPGM